MAFGVSYNVPGGDDVGFDFLFLACAELGQFCQVTGPELADAGQSVVDERANCTTVS